MTVNMVKVMSSSVMTVKLNLTPEELSKILQYAELNQHRYDRLPDRPTGREVRELVAEVAKHLMMINVERRVSNQEAREGREEEAGLGDPALGVERRVWAGRVAARVLRRRARRERSAPDGAPMLELELWD